MFLTFPVGLHILLFISILYHHTLCDILVALPLLNQRSFKTRWQFRKMSLRGLVLVFAIFSSVIDAIPTIAYPLNSQVPPAARISTPFSYAFSTSTFSSTLPMTYTLSSGPKWLSLDSDSRILSGTPSTEDVGTDTVTGVPIGLTASDSTGSITLNATLVVSKNPAPSVQVPATQLASSGKFSAPSTLRYHPSTPFNFSFQPATFTRSDGSSTFIYYAVTSTNTPLPSWIHFDDSTISFTGQSPDYQSLIQPPQTFGIQLIATDIEGFGGASLYFDIEVGVHLLAFKNTEMVINGTVGETLRLDGLFQDLELDGQAPNSSDIVATSAQIPSWMTFNNSSLALTGTVPVDAASFNITVQVTDIYGDTAEAFIQIIIPVSLFSKSIGSLNATTGSTFSYDLGIYLTNRSDTEMMAQILPPQAWISFNPQTLIIAGQIPPSTQPSTILITLSATSKSRQTTKSQAFDLLIFANNQTLTSTAPHHSTTLTSRTSQVPTSSRTVETSSIAANSPKRLGNDIILAIVIPLGILFLAMLLILCCYYPRRHAAKKLKETGKVEKRSISSPLEATPSIAESFQTIESVSTIPPPPPLQLDMSGFGIQNDARPGTVLGPISGAETAEGRRHPSGVANNPLRRSLTMSTAPGSQVSHLSQSHHSGFGNRARSKSDNALSDDSWRYTQNSEYLTMRSSGTSSSQTHNLNRNYSNYSRKGHSRRPTMFLSANQVHPTTHSNPPIQPRESTILNLRDSNFSLTPLESFSALEKGSVLTDTNAALPSVLPSTEVPIPPKSAKRQSRFITTTDRSRGIGHGRQESILSFSGIPAKRRSIGHGQDWSDGRGLDRDPRNLFNTANLPGNEKRRSNAGTSSPFESPKRASVSPRKTIRQVTKSPSIPPQSMVLSESSGNSRLSRPVSRRVGSSPFFGGSSIRTSGKISKKPRRTSYADSPTVPEEAIMDTLEATIAQGLRDMSDELDHRDSFGISYGMAREETRQLRSYIQSHLGGRTRTRTSIRSYESRDSRFESATGSISHTERSPHGEPPRGDEFYEDYTPDGFSDGSWETQRSARDDEGSVVTDGDGLQSPEHGYGNSKSTPATPEIGRAARIVNGAGRRPMSVDARGVKRVHTQRGEMDHTAYI
ncbi:hypothetical protein ONS95_003151 [Cadophora gregata]|uniref:uncharacterized protein n=1 Tax=Cadophora gregata TaxID=51156 RepID=UPI0026DC4D7A|nr:uncharacterized protein ONS95_003151 [Cadophora gregata]KAK0108336.1 hypothetical protein ONS95_003151 [Cadophora gregata]KAK0109073.1 hypothetical protein ONS96_002902 [Cadophora gregata f. sp. sojae]